MVNYRTFNQPPPEGKLFKPNQSQSLSLRGPPSIHLHLIFYTLNYSLNRLKIGRNMYQVRKKNQIFHNLIFFQVGNKLDLEKLKFQVSTDRYNNTYCYFQIVYPKE